MQAESLEVLEKADVASAQARTFVRAIEIELARAEGTLATKQGLLSSQQSLLSLRQDLRAEISELRTGLEGKIHESATANIRLLYWAVLGQMALLLGFAHFFATYVR